MPQHHAWVVIPSYSHHASAAAIIGQCLRTTPDLQISMMCHASVAQVMTQKWNRSFPPNIASRLNIVPTGDATIVPDIKNGERLFGEMIAGAGPFVKSLASPPTKYILGMFGGHIFAQHLKKALPDLDAEVWIHAAASAGWLWQTIAPAPDGGGSYKQKIAEHVKLNGPLSPDEEKDLIVKFMFACNGTTEINDDVVHIPGMGEMYHYEQHASNGPTAPILATWTSWTVDFSKFADGVVIATSPSLEQGLLDALSGQIKVVSVGLNSDTRNWEGATLEPGPLKEFLDRYDDANGDGVIYISFGTIYWPPQFIAEFLETLLDLKRPFLLNHSRPHPPALPDELIQRIMDSPTSFLNLEFIDQIAVLTHPAIRWFLNQGGWNSITESIIAGVPLLIWPLANNDQPYHGALVSLRDEPIGFEMLQIRADHRPARRGVEIKGTAEAVKEETKEIMALTRGEEGSKRVRNVKNLREKVKQENEQGTRALLEFCKS